MKLTVSLDRCPKELEELDYVCGVDEVGRGCGAGIVMASAVILPKGFSSPLLRDSKKLSEKQRLLAYDLIIKNAISYSFGISSVSDIDRLGINGAILSAMVSSIKNLSSTPQHILIDGLSVDIPIDMLDKTTFVVKGDDTYSSIAAAAIIAKVERDKYMTNLSTCGFSEYLFEKNKGYLTAEHIAAIRLHGATEHHREMFVRNFVK